MLKWGYKVWWVHTHIVLYLLLTTQYNTITLEFKRVFGQNSAKNEGIADIVFKILANKSTIDTTVK
jgi:hypothetical protein